MTFLGLSIQRQSGECIEHQPVAIYLESLLNRFNIGECKPTRTSLATGLKLTKCTDKAKETDKPYRESIGFYNYITT